MSAFPLEKVKTAGNQLLFRNAPRINPLYSNPGIQINKKKAHKAPFLIALLYQNLNEVFTRPPNLLAPST